MKYATLDDSLRKVKLGGRSYEVEVHCLCDSSGNKKHLTILKGKHSRIDEEVLQRFLMENLEDHELYACSFYKQFNLDYPIAAYINRKTKRKQPEEIRKLFERADRGAWKHSKTIKRKLKSLRDLRRDGNTGHINGLELLLVDV